MTRRTAVLLGLLTVVASACSGGGDNAEPANKHSVETATTEAATTTTAVPRLGAVRGSHGGTVVARNYQQPVAAGAPSPTESGSPAGYVWGGLDVEVCLPSEAGEYAVASYVWKLTMPDHSSIEPSSSIYDQFPQPEYPFEQAVTPGQCVRGWIVFPVPGDSRPTGVSYAPDSSPLTWVVPSA